MKAPVPEGAPYTLTREARVVSFARANTPCPWLEYAHETGSLRFRSDRVGCTKTTLAQSALVADELLDALARALDGELVVKTFGLNAYPEMYERIARAVKRAPAWDVRRGKPSNGSLHTTILELAADASFYPEIVALFRGLALAPRLVGVEKVFVGPVSATPFASALLEAGLRATDRVPYGSEVWFALAPSPAHRD